jgi:hypothetical protein
MLNIAVDGADKGIKAGKYRGKITLTVTGTSWEEAEQVMGYRFLKSLTAVCAVALIMAFLSVGIAASMAAAAANKDLAAGSTWTINETTKLTGLTLGKGAVIEAPEGNTVTMTVNGVETPIQAGSYKGNIVLTVAKAIVIKASVFGDVSTYQMRAAIDVEDGVYLPEKSVAAAVIGGKVTNSSAKNISITSVGKNFNGIIVSGNSTYSIDNAKINLTGEGGNDFAGYGAGIMTEGKANVTVNNASIIAKGAIRTTIAVRGESTIHVNNSDIQAYNGPLPDDYAFKWQKPNGPLMQVPWFLGLVGTNRATMLVDSGTAHYNNSHIKAQGWGALSTDGVKDVKLYTTNCHVETTESGYGSYADGSYNSFSKTKFDVKDYALIMTGGTGIFTDESVVNSGRFGVMIHGSGNLTIDKGSAFYTKKAVIQVKGSFPTIVVDNARLLSESDIILQAMENDDPNKGGGAPGGAGGAPQGGAAAGGGMAGGPGGPGGPPGGMPGGEAGRGGAREGGAPGGGMRGGPGGANALTATFKNMTLNGDIVSSMTNLGDVVVNFEKTTITGAITTATAEHAVGPNGEKLVMKEETDLYYLIGDIKESYCATNEKFGVKISLDKNSKWIVSRTSYLTGLTLAEGASVIAPAGYKLTLSVEGAAKEIKPGEHKGKITLAVAKSQEKFQE